MTNKGKILIIDDSKLNRNILSKIIEDETDYIAFTAESGAEAFKVIKKDKPDLILLDIIMPDIDGFEVAKQLKSSPDTMDISIIFITALTDEQNIIKGFDSGGIDYITKPFSKIEVISRITALVKLRKQYDEIIRLNNKIVNEIAIAKSIQQAIMPNTDFDFPKLSVNCRFIPLEEVSGDYFDVIEINENTYFIFIVDVTGHGIPASLYTMMLKSHFYYITQSFSKPSEIMDRLNTDISNMLLDDFFPTALLLKIDFEKMELSYSNAAHPNPIYFSKNNDKIIKLTKKDFPLGIDPSKNYGEDTIKINKNDRIFIYTDGIINVEDRKGDFFNSDFLDKMIISTLHLPVKKQIDKLLNIIKIASKSGYFDDDVTFLGVDIK